MRCPSPPLPPVTSATAFLSSMNVLPHAGARSLGAPSLLAGRLRSIPRSRQAGLTCAPASDSIPDAVGLTLQGAEGAAAATEARPPVAERRLLPPAAAVPAGACLGL